jgi:Zn-dependent peptidase ImmA (M78 family)
MRRVIDARIEPKILTWARKSIGMDLQDAARKVKIDEEKIRKWESGEEKIRLNYLEKLADVYKRPLATFFLEEPPKELPLPEDFRSLPDDSRPFSSKTLIAIRRFRYMQSLYMELASELNIPAHFKLKKFNLDNKPESLANQIRKELAIDLRKQFHWSDEREALIEWKKIIEDQGILILEISMPLEEGRAFSFTDNKIPMIVINTGDAPNGKIFSIFHELGHILINHGGICNPMAKDTENIKIERFCNYFAGAFLVPKDYLIKLFSSYEGKYDFNEALRQLAKKYKVSKFVILRRLFIIGLINKNLYEKKFEELETEFKEKKKAKGGVLAYSEKCIRKNGIRFSSLVLNAHRMGKITYSDVSDYLDVNLRHIPKIEERLLGIIT